MSIEFWFAGYLAIGFVMALFLAAGLEQAHRRDGSKWDEVENVCCVLAVVLWPLLVFGVALFQFARLVRFLGVKILDGVERRIKE